MKAGVVQTQGLLMEDRVVDSCKSLIYWGRDLNSRPPDPQSPGFIPDSVNLTKRQTVETSQQFNKLFFNTTGKSGGRSCLIMFSPQALTKYYRSGQFSPLILIRACGRPRNNDMGKNQLMAPGIRLFFIVVLKAGVVSLPSPSMRGIL